MAADELIVGLDQAIADWLATPADDEQLISATEELGEVIDSAIGSSETLQRLRRTEERMGRSEEIFTGWADFPYEITTSSGSVLVHQSHPGM